jgi:hypothetical protein
MIERTKSYLVKELNEHICRQGVPSWTRLLYLLACFVVSWRYEILEGGQIQPSKSTDSKKLGRNVCSDIIMLG